MLNKNSLKRQAFKILTQPFINGITRSVVKSILKLNRRSRLIRLPAAGNLQIGLPDGSHFFMESYGDDVIATMSFYLGGLGFEEETSGTFFKLVQPGLVFFDIGANSGNYSLMASTKVRGIEVHAFEPLPRVYKVLERNKVINGFDNIQIHKLALAETNGYASFFVETSITLPSGGSLNESQQDDDPLEIRVQTQRLDDFIVEHEITKIDLIKIDTESTEPAVLRGGEQAILKWRPIIFCEVLEEDAAHELEKFWKGKNYLFYWCKAGLGPVKVSGIRPSKEEGFRNYIFVPQEKETEFLSKLKQGLH